MSTDNGNGKRILSLDDKRMQNPRKANDFITVQQCYDLVIQECAKVHEHYLTQMPNYMARMITDALREFGLVKVVAGDGDVPIIVAASDPRPAVEVPVAPVEAPAVSENTGGGTPPADSTTPAELAE